MATTMRKQIAQNKRNTIITILVFVAFIGAIAGIFWKPAIYVVVVIAAVMFGMFLHDFIRFVRMK